MSDIEQRLEASKRRRQAALSAAELEAVHARGLIIEAIAAGLSHRRIAELSGYSFPRIGQIGRFVDGDWRKGKRNG